MKLNEFFDKMVDILIKIDQPYKKLIGELLGISCIKKEKFYLMEYVVKYKNASKEKENMKEKYIEKNESKIIKLLYFGGNNSTNFRPTPILKKI